ncbi:uncharacterized protein [Elaeis guineensis]|uniref:uncharacterized protein n=1 Tax=Elaeis guineensis var. tenera TaxID=51953 RepID=UPI003C6CCB87
MESHATKMPWFEKPIIFTEQDAEGVQTPHNDTMVITADIANYNAHHIFIDNGSFIDILYFAVFTAMGQVTIYVDFLVLNLPSTYNAEKQPAAPQPKLPIGLDACNDLAGEHARPSEDLVEIPLRNENLHQIMKIGSSIDQGTKAQLTALLQKNVDMFTWTVADISGIDPEVMIHYLGVDPTFHPIKQKKRSFIPEHQKVIAEEVDKLVNVGFIQEAMYPD